MGRFRVGSGAALGCGVSLRVSLRVGLGLVWGGLIGVGLEWVADSFGVFRGMSTVGGFVFTVCGRV